MFPSGDPEWNINIKSYDPNRIEIKENSTDQVDRNKAEVSVMFYYSSRLMIRIEPNSTVPKNEQVPLHSFWKLFHQYVVDQYAIMEQQRLNYIRFNQQALCAELYNGLMDAIHFNDTDMSAIRQTWSVCLRFQFEAESFAGRYY